MAKITKSKTIDNHEYTVTSFNGREGLKIKNILLKHLGPAFLSLIATGLFNNSDNKKTEFLEQDISPDTLYNIFEKLCSKMNEDAFINFVLRLLQETRRDGVEITEEILDMEFSGEYMSLYKVLLFVLEVNYKKSFLDQIGIGNIMGKIKPNPMPEQKD